MSKLELSIAWRDRGVAGEGGGHEDPPDDPPGGGGHGEASARPRELVERDLALGYYSADEARRLFAAPPKR